MRAEKEYRSMNRRIGMSGGLLVQALGRTRAPVKTCRSLQALSGSDSAGSDSHDGFRVDLLDGDELSCELYVFETIFQ
jgi:hypothetical protein